MSEELYYIKISKTLDMCSVSKFFFCVFYKFPNNNWYTPPQCQWGRGRRGHIFDMEEGNDFSASDALPKIMVV